MLTLLPYTRAHGFVWSARRTNLGAHRVAGMVISESMESMKMGNSAASGDSGVGPPELPPPKNGISATRCQRCLKLLVVRVPPPFVQRAPLSYPDGTQRKPAAPRACTELVVSMVLV